MVLPTPREAVEMTMLAAAKLSDLLYSKLWVRAKGFRKRVEDVLSGALDVFDLLILSHVELCDEPSRGEVCFIYDNIEVCMPADALVSYVPMNSGSIRAIMLTTSTDRRIGGINSFVLKMIAAEAVSGVEDAKQRLAIKVGKLLTEHGIYAAPPSYVKSWLKTIDAAAYLVGTAVTISVPK